MDATKGGMVGIEGDFIAKHNKGEQWVNNGAYF